MAMAAAASVSVAAPSSSVVEASSSRRGGLQSQFLGNGIAVVGSKSSRRKCRLCVNAKIREIFMPALSSTMTEGKIVQWMKSEGDKLNKGESVVVVESDKADMDVETFYDGYLASILVDEGEVAPTGATIAVLAETLEEVPEAKAKYASGPAAPAAASTPPPPPPPQLDAVPAAPVSAPAISAPTPTSAPAVTSVHPASEGGKRTVATPYAKKLAKELKVDLATIAGSGPSGRITASDVEAAKGKSPVAVAEPVTVAAPLPTPSAASVPAPAEGKSAPFTGMQAAVSRNMLDSLSVPSFRVGYTITTDALDALYKKIKSKGVTMSALLAKATALALLQHPVMNASCKDGKSFKYNSSINIAVAVAIDGGLITPVLQDADKLDIYTLSKKWKELVEKARAKQLQPNEYSTGTFTMSNLGMFGVDRFDAILPPGTGAIMAVGASSPTVVATPDGLFGVKNQMQVNVTADHRIIYGADVAAFLQTLAKIIEDPKDLTL